MANATWRVSSDYNVVVFAVVVFVDIGPIVNPIVLVAFVIPITVIVILVVVIIIVRPGDRG